MRPTGFPLNEESDPTEPSYTYSFLHQPSGIVKAPTIICNDNSSNNNNNICINYRINNFINNKYNNIIVNIIVVKHVQSGGNRNVDDRKYLLIISPDKYGNHWVCGVSILICF